MNFSKPSAVGGGGEIRRVTSAVPSAANRSFASLARSSRSVIIEPVSTGRPLRQSLRGVTGTWAGKVIIATVLMVAMLVTASFQRVQSAPDDVVDIIGGAPNDVVAVVG